MFSEAPSRILLFKNNTASEKDVTQHISIDRHKQTCSNLPQVIRKRSGQLTKEYTIFLKFD